MLVYKLCLREKVVGVTKAVWGNKSITAEKEQLYTFKLNLERKRLNDDQGLLKQVSNPDCGVPGS